MNEIVNNTTAKYSTDGEEMQALNAKEIENITIVDGPDKLTAPIDIHVPNWLREFIAKQDRPQSITNAYLIEIGREALAAKIAETEAVNMSMPARLNKRVPDTLSFADVAVLMMSIMPFKNIKMSNKSEGTMLAMYDNDKSSPKYGTYVNNESQILYIAERLAPDFNNNTMKDVLSKLSRSVPAESLTRSPRYAAVNNGVFDRETGTLQPFSPDYVFITKAPVNYNPEAVNPVIINEDDNTTWDVESWIADVLSGDPDTIELIWQVIADCLQPNISRDKSIWFYSTKGNNGKGTIGQLIKNLLGDNNYSSLNIDAFGHEYMLEELLGKSANIADENNTDKFIDKVENFKATITGDDITINRKYEKPIKLQVSITNIQMVNKLPRVQDTSSSFYRRILPVPFLKSFTNNGERKYIKQDYITRKVVLEYVLHKALNLKFEEFTVPENSMLLLADYQVQNNPVLEFWNQHKDRFVWDLLPAQFVYDVYQGWYKKDYPGGKVLSKKNFDRDLQTIIEQDDDWVHKAQANTGKIPGPQNLYGKLMQGDEPLISEYALDSYDRSGNPSEWMAQSSPHAFITRGTVESRNFTRKAKYRNVYVRV